MSKLTEEITTIVEQACKSNANFFGEGIWTHHIVHVVRFAKSLAKEAGVQDIEVIELGALLHDYAGIKDHSLFKEHHLHGADEAQRILEERGVDQARINKVKEMITNHRGSVPYEGDSVEVRVLRDADAMAHIVSVPSLLLFAFTKKKMNVDEASTWLLQKLERSWNKLSPAAKNMVAEQYTAAKHVLKGSANTSS